MKFSTLVVFALSLLSGCHSSRDLTGRYLSGRHMDLDLNDSESAFQFYGRSGSGITEYSQGSFTVHGRKMHLVGFSKDSLTVLQVVVLPKVPDSLQRARRVVLFRAVDPTQYIENAVFMEGRAPIRFTTDTMLPISGPVHTAIVKSYLLTDRYAINPPKADTLFSGPFSLSTDDKQVAIHTSIKDFYRVPFDHHVIIKARGRLKLFGVIFWKERKLKIVGGKSITE